MPHTAQYLLIYANNMIHGYQIVLLVPIPTASFYDDLTVSMETK